MDAILGGEQPSVAQRVKVDLPPPLTAAPAPTGAATKPISLTRLAANIAPGTPWAAENQSPYFMAPCIGEGEVALWNESSNKIEQKDPFERVFREELKTAGFKSGSDPTNLFDEGSTADLQVGALITDIRYKSCNYITLVNTSLSGSGVMSVEWQIYSVSQAKVLARIATRGGIEIKGSKDDIIGAVIRGAFGDNVRRLAADPQFRQLVTTGASAAPPPPMTTTLKLTPVAARIPIATAAQSVVAVFAGDGHGSGVVISADGYILTNHHVAGASGQVRIRWADGTDAVGEVLRGDRRRDIALVKVAPKAVALPIRPTPAEVGEAVFAIGTPLDPKFQGSVSKGIVSARRSYEGLTYIQSEVTVNPGNSGGPLLDEKGSVLGITVLRFGAEGIPTGINLFIPIDDALRALALTPAG